MGVNENPVENSRPCVCGGGGWGYTPIVTTIVRVCCFWGQYTLQSENKVPLIQPLTDMHHTHLGPGPTWAGLGMISDLCPTGGKFRKFSMHLPPPFAPPRERLYC